MSIAVVKGKVSNAGSEDLLTASVFGRLRYLPYNNYLKPILELSRNLSDDTFTLTPLNGMPNIEFWPTKYKREPDIELSTDTTKLFIEVKFHSSKSGEEEHDQLANQYEDLCNDLDNKKAKEGVIIYLTKDRVMPEVDLNNSIENITKKDLKGDFRKNLYWLSWFDIWEFLSNQIEDIDSARDKTIVQDIIDLLNKQGLKHFTGFSAAEFKGNINSPNHTSTIMDSPKENLRNAFQMVQKTLEETSVLIKDFEGELLNKENGLISLHNGTEIGTESSNSVNVGEKWLKKFVMRYYLPKKHEHSYKHLLGISVAYNFEAEPNESPKLILGIIDNSLIKQNKEKYYYWWIPFLYASKSLHKYEPNVSSRSELKAGTWYKVDPSPSEKHHIPLFESGHLYFVDLLDVKSKADVKNLAVELKCKYEALN